MYLQNGIPLLVFAIGFFSSANGQLVVCPAVRTSSGWLDLFPLPCRKHTECGVMGKQHLCCNGFCTKGIRQQAVTTRPNDQPSSSVESSSTSTSSTTSTTTSTSTTTTTTTTTTPSTTSSTTTTTTTTTTPPPPPPPPPPTQLPNPLLQLIPLLNQQLAQARTSTTPQPKTSSPAKTGTTDIIADVNYSHSHNSATFYNYNVDSTVDYPSAGKAQKLVCPKPGQAPVILFPIPCENNAQCRLTSGSDQVCCERRCVKGVLAPRPTSAPRSHQPLLGVIPRECPSAPLGELLFEVQSCKTDADCWPRVCCPDGTRSYCRTAKARLDRVPIVNQIDGPVRMLEQYLQCTAPPQFDLFSKPCSSSVDCFPNLCCAEGGKKHCRPAQRSLFAFLAGLTGRVGATLSSLRPAAATLTNRI